MCGVEQQQEQHGEQHQQGVEGVEGVMGQAERIPVCCASAWMSGNSFESRQ
jgi:hypothetical protein